MNGIQLILLPLVGLLGWYAIKKFKGTVIVIFAMALCLLGMSLVIFPDFSTTIAQMMGVKRGVDMLFYFSFVLMFLIIIRMYAKIRSLEEQITLLVRRHALEDVNKET